MRVLQLTPEQLNSLPPKEREQIMQLVCPALCLFLEYALTVRVRGDNSA